MLQLSEFIRAVALAPVGDNVQSIVDAEKLDSTSGSVTARVRQVVVLQNSKGFYAAVVDGNRRFPSARVGELQITYWILIDGSRDFSSVFEPAAMSIPLP